MINEGFKFTYDFTLNRDSFSGNAWKEICDIYGADPNRCESIVCPGWSRARIIIGCDDDG